MTDLLKAIIIACSVTRNARQEIGGNKITPANRLLCEFEFSSFNFVIQRRGRRLKDDDVAGDVE